MIIRFSIHDWLLAGFRGGWIKNAGYMVDSYKKFLEENPEMTKHLNLEQRQRIEESQDVHEIIEILERSYHVRLH